MAEPCRRKNYGASALKEKTLSKWRKSLEHDR
jgi:hypothetical protein